jgi:hypothetical protein
LKTWGFSNRDLKSIASFATFLIFKELKEVNKGVGKEFKVIIFIQRGIAGLKTSVSESDPCFAIVTLLLLF